MTTSRIRRIYRPKRIRIVTIAIVFLAFILYWLLARAVQGVDFRLSPSPTLDNLLDNLPLLEPLLIFFELFSLSVLRHFTPLLFGVASAWLIATELLAQLYDLPSNNDGGKMLNRLISGSGGTVSIDRQNFAEQQVTEELIRTGGPGYVNIGASDVAVTTINGRFERVVGGGRQRLRRFERVIAVLDLREQEREHKAVTLMTKDGLALKTTLTCNFYLERRPDPSQPHLDYTFDDDSVRRAAFATAITQTGVRRWDDLPLQIGIVQLRRVVGSKRLDELIDPKYVFERAPHPAIQAQVEQNTRDILRQYGIHLVSASTTALEMTDEMHETLLDYWKVFGEKAKALAEKPQDPDFDSADIARRQAREKMISSLTKGLQNIRQGNNATGFLPAASSAVEPVKPDGNQLLAMQMLQMLERFYRQQSTPASQPETADTDSEPLLLESERNEPEKKVEDSAETAAQKAPEDNTLPNELANLLKQYLPPTE